VAATKTFASQVVATLAMLAVAVGRDRGALGAADARSVLEDLRGLPGAVQQVLDEEDQVREAAREYGDGEAFFFVGRALECARGAGGRVEAQRDFVRPRRGFAAGSSNTARWRW